MTDHGHLPLERFDAGALSAPISVERLVEAFLAGKNPRTVKAYERDLEVFARHVGASSREEAARMLLGAHPGTANAMVLSFKTSELNRGRSSATIARRLSAVRALVQLARLTGLVTWSIEVDNPDHEAARDMSGPSREHVLAMLAHLERVALERPTKGARDLALVRLLYDCALRCSEALECDLQHLFLLDPHLMIRRKGRRQRERIDLPAPTVHALEAWLKKHPSGNDLNAPLFVSMDRNPANKGKARVTPCSVRRMTKLLGQACGVPGVVRPHGFRHSAATWLLDTTKDLRLVQAFLGHRSIATTQRYDDSRKRLQGEAARMVAGGDGG